MTRVLMGVLFVSFSTLASSQVFDDAVELIPDYPCDVPGNDSDTVPATLTIEGRRFERSKGR